jgi:alcohol dehydrogenase class IV
MPVGDFVYQGTPARVVFGSGTIVKVATEAERLGVGRALVISTPEQKDQAERVASLLGGRAGAVFSGARMHTPADVTTEAMALVARTGIDGTVAIGGGSTTGLGKAIALRTDLPQIVIPTTYAGSEMTDILGETSAGEKKTIRDARVVPETVIYDVELTLTLPVRLSVTSGFNAIAHAVEGLYAPDSNPILSLMAEEGIRALAAAIPRIVSDGSDKDARSEALHGAWLCATVLSGTSMALHHRLCHVLGGTFDLPHAETHTIVLPHAVAYNAAAAADAISRVARAIGTANAAAGLFDLARSAGVPTALRDLGLAEGDLDRATDLAVATPYPNPRPIDRASIRALLDDAWAGRRPDQASGIRYQVSDGGSSSAEPGTHPGDADT